MLGIAIIVFREVLEAALVIGIVMAATRGVQGRGRWVLAGIAAGILASIAVALSASAITGLADGLGQEMMQAGVLSAAVLLITWHVVWMHTHGRQMAAQLRTIGQEVKVGAKHMSVLATVVALALLREGSEIVLLLQGFAAETPVSQLGLSGLAGLVVGVVCGFLLYRGFTIMPVNAMFTATNWVLVLIAAGMMARAANYLVQADLLPPLGEQMWDTSALLPEQSFIGQLLVTLVGYMEQPSGIQLLAYGLTIGVIVVLMSVQNNNKKFAYTVASLLIGGLLLLSTDVRAESIKSPYVEEGMLELEHKGVLTTDTLDGRDSDQEYELAVAYGFTSWMMAEFEAEYEGDEDSVELKKYKAESVFQLADQGEYWVDPGFFFAYAFGQNNAADSITFGPVFAKSIGMIDNKLNLFYARDLGEHAAEGSSFKYSWQSVYAWQPWLKPGFEVFGDTKKHDAFKDQSLKVGPVITGKLPGFSDAGGFKYEVGYLFGTTDATPDGTLRWKIEYELPL